MRRRHPTPALYRWSHAGTLFARLADPALHQLPERERLLAELELLSFEVDCSPGGPGAGRKPAWAALADLLERRVREAQLEHERAQEDDADLASYDWTRDQINEALDARPDLIQRSVTAMEVLYVDREGGQFAWERHPRVDDRWRWVTADLSEGHGGLEAPRNDHVPGVLPTPASEEGPSPAPVELEDGQVALVDTRTGELLRVLEGGAAAEEEDPIPEPDVMAGEGDPEGDLVPAETDDEGGSAGGTSPPADPAHAEEPAGSEDAAWEDEKASLLDYCTEIEEAGARCQALEAAQAARTLEEFAHVRTNVAVTVEREAGQRARMGRAAVPGQRYGGVTRKQVQAEKAAARKPAGGALARERARLRGAHYPVTGPEAEAARARCVGLMAEVWPVAGTAPRSLRDEIEQADMQGLERIESGLLLDVEARREKAGRA